MEDPNVFLTLTPDDRWGLSADGFRLPHNSARYFEPSAFDDGPSRETTPSCSVHNETPVCELEYFHRVELRFDQDTKVKGRVSFGSDPARSDVLLTLKRGQYGISGVHFCITFDDQQRPVIRDVSMNGLTVSYDGQAKGERRKHFQWILFPEYNEIGVTLPLQYNQELAINVHLPQHYRTHRKDYKNKVQGFMNGSSEDYEVAIDNLTLRSQNTSFAPSESLSPTKRPVYLRREELGHGAYGRVRKVVNATTGFEYAGKEFFHSTGWEREIDIIKKLRHVRYHFPFENLPTLLLLIPSKGPRGFIFRLPKAAGTTSRHGVSTARKFATTKRLQSDRRRRMVRSSTPVPGGSRLSPPSQYSASRPQA